MHIEKNSLFSKLAAPASKANFTHSRRVDLSKPNPVRVLACSSGKHIAVINIGLLHHPRRRHHRAFLRWVAVATQAGCPGAGG
jgi:hypothetical protein